MKIRTILTILLPMLLLSACQHKKTQILGDWVIDAASSKEEGFQLARNGQAASINQPRCHYSSWSKNKNTLVLSGKLFEDNNVRPFSDTLTIVKLTGDQLWLKQDTTLYSYTRL